MQKYQQEMEILVLCKDQNYFIAFGWITNKERQLFQLFCHVFKIDVIKGMNKKSHIIEYSVTQCLSC